MRTGSNLKVEGVLDIPESGAAGALVRLVGRGGVRAPQPHAIHRDDERPGSWILFIPAAAYVVWLGIGSRDLGKIPIAGSFLAVYAFFLISPRQILSMRHYSLVPLGFIAVCGTAEKLLGRWSWAFLGWRSHGVCTCIRSRRAPDPEAAYLWILRTAGLA